MTPLSGLRELLVKRPFVQRKSVDATLRTRRRIIILFLAADTHALGVKGRSCFESTAIPLTLQLNAYGCLPNYGMRSRFLPLLTTLFSFFFGSALLTDAFAANPTTDKNKLDEKLWSGMKWRQVGPFRGGRALAIEGVPGEPNTYYFGAVAGGVWKTIDGGGNWAPLFDKQPISSIGAIAVAPSDHNVIYVGTGECAPRGNMTYGNGIYKSIDAGKTWKNVGLQDSRQIGALIVHPQNPDIVLVAAFGHAFGPNQERGIFRTTDGGKTWTKVLYKDENTGGIDIVFDPHNPNVVFAALWQARRQPWNFSSGGPGSGLYRSEDNGVTWKQLTGNGLPDGILGRIGISVSGADANRIYAIVEAKEGGIFRSDDGGEKWTKVNEDGRFRQRAWYFSKIYADPKSPDTVYVLNTGAFKSVDGGKTFNLLPARHGDHHGLWIDPQNPDRIGNANDGGASISNDGGKTWTTLNNQPTAQFYHVAVDNAFPVSHLRRATGQLERGHREPDRLRYDRTGRLVSCRRRRVRLRPARSARLAYHLLEQRRLHHALR